MLEDRPPTDLEFNDAIQRIQDFFSQEGTIHHLSDNLYGRRSAFSDSDLHRGGINGTFTGHAIGKSLSEEIQGSKPSFHPPPSRFGDSLPYRDVRPDQKVAPGTLRTPTLPSSGHTDAGGALGGVLGVSPTGELPAEDTLPEHDSSESQVPALPARRTWRLDGTDRRMSDDEEVPIERNAVERNRSNKMDGIRMPLESGLSSSLRAARGGIPERESAMCEDNTENSEADSGALTSFTPRLPNVSNDRVLSPNFAKERTSSSTASAIMWKLKLGIPQTEESAEDQQERNMKYIHIPERGREQFQQFAKALKDKLTVECAESNPYVKALCQHRQEMAESGLDLGNEAVDSLPARLATERSDALASMETDEDMARERSGERQNCDLYCRGKTCEKRPRWDMMELKLPEMEERLRRRNGGALVPSPRVQQRTSSSERSTAPETQQSELQAQARRGLVICSKGSDQDSLRLRIGRSRLDLSADDRLDFLSAIGATPPGPVVLKSPTPSNVSIPGLSIRASEGDTSQDPNIDGD